MPANRAIALCILLVPLVAAPLAGQAVVGRVVDEETGAGIEGARVSVRHVAGRLTGTARTDAGGGFVVAAHAAGAYRVEAEARGFATPDPIEIRLAAAEELHVEIRLSRQVVSLEPLVVTGRRRDPRHDATWEGALARREAYGNWGFRRVIMRGDVQTRASLTVAEAIRDLPAPRSRDLAHGPRNRATEDGPRYSRPGCNIVYWNGRLVTQQTTAAWLLTTSTVDVEAIEVYRTWHDAPQEMRDLPTYVQTSPANCSVVALWPRIDPPERGGGPIDVSRTLVAAVIIGALVVVLPIF